MFILLCRQKIFAYYFDDLIEHRIDGANLVSLDSRDIGGALIASFYGIDESKYAAHHRVA